MYLKRIGLGGPTFDPKVVAPTLENLTKVMRRHMVTFPWECLEMHYSEDGLMAVSLTDIFRRMVIEGKGGGCGPQNGLLLQMLRGLGYRGYSCAARVANEPNPSPQTHIVLIIIPSDARGDMYLVDVATGGPGPVRPIKLRAGGTVKGAASPDEHRLVYGSPPASAIDWSNTSSSPNDSSTLLAQSWQLEIRRGEGKTWRPVYRFALSAELLAEDYRARMLDVAMREEGPHRKNVIVLQYFVDRRGADGEEELGRLVLYQNVVKKYRGDASEVVAVLGSEQERVAALKEYFGIKITAEELENIRRRASALAFAPTVASAKL